MYGFCFKLLACEQASKDIVQETLVRIWEKRESIDTNKALNAYIFKIARNLVLDHINEYSRKAQLTFDHLEQEVPASILQQLSYDETKQVEENVVGRLPSQQQQIYQLSRYEHLSNPEIANQMGISVNSVKTHLRLALKTLRKHLDPVVAIAIPVIGSLLQG